MIVFPFFETDGKNSLKTDMNKLGIIIETGIYAGFDSKKE
jgi:hypothetical protein